MPPEMIRKEYHGLPVDIWSFGSVLLRRRTPLTAARHLHDGARQWRTTQS